MLERVQSLGIGKLLIIVGGSLLVAVVVGVVVAAAAIVLGVENVDERTGGLLSAAAAVTFLVWRLRVATKKLSANPREEERTERKSDM